MEFQRSLQILAMCMITQRAQNTSTTICPNQNPCQTMSKPKSKIRTECKVNHVVTSVSLLYIKPCCNVTGHETSRIFGKEVARKTGGGGSRKTLTDLTDSGVSVVSDTPPCPTKDSSRVLSWLIQSETQQIVSGSGYSHSDSSSRHKARSSGASGSSSSNLQRQAYVPPTCHYLFHCFSISYHATLFHYEYNTPNSTTTVKF
jgi:hypothetical protein